MKKEKLTIKFLGFKIETENPTQTTVIIVAMVLLFLTLLILK